MHRKPGTKYQQAINEVYTPNVIRQIMKTAIYPAIWFNNKAREAAEFYCYVFNSSKIVSENPSAVEFEAWGQRFLGINGGPEFIPNPSISFYVVYENKHELDYTWEKLMQGGTVMMPLDSYDWSQRYGWLKDKYNVSWQLTLGIVEEVGQRISPVLMFTESQNGNAEKAIDFYTSVFKDGSVDGIFRYTDEHEDTAGNIAHARFRLENTVLMAMDSSYPHGFGFNEAISLVVECDNQAEIDYYWEKLSSVPEAEQCGWLKDQFGVSWQIIPAALSKMMSNPERAPKVVKAFLQMKKMDLKKLEEAYNHQE